jgi:tol-pal system protein YbgF
MTIRITATRAVLAAGLALAYVALVPATPQAADREHQQIMADLRILQEQTQQLQALMNDLGEALKAVNSRIDEQSSLERKAFADGKVQMDTMSGDLRVVREKVDETNVRLGTITQELESIRQAIPEPGAYTNVPVTSDAAGTPGAPGTPGTTDQTGLAPPSGTAPTVPPLPAGIQPQRLWDTSYSDYTVGNYTLAVQGFEQYLRAFPKSARAHEAQLYAAESLALDKKDMEAVVAYERVISNYPGSASVPTAYYKRGLALERLGEAARAKESYESVIKEFPDSQQATLARQRLEGLNRPAR